MVVSVFMILFLGLLSARLRGGTAPELRARPRGAERWGHGPCRQGGPLQVRAGPKPPQLRPPSPRRPQTAGRKGAGRDRLSVSPGGTIKFRKFEKAGKKKKTLAPSAGRVWTPAARGEPGARRAGMGVTVDVRQVYKYPFEQVVASFLRKVPAHSGPDARHPGALAQPSALGAPGPVRAPASTPPRESPPSPSRVPAAGFSGYAGRGWEWISSRAPLRGARRHVHTLSRSGRERKFWSLLEAAQDLWIFLVPHGPLKS